MKKISFTQSLIALIFLVISLLNYTSLNAQWSCYSDFFDMGTFDGTLTFEAVSLTGNPCDAQIKITNDNLDMTANAFTINNGTCTNCPTIQSGGITTFWDIDGNSGMGCGDISITINPDIGGTCGGVTTPVLTALPVELIQFKGNSTPSSNHLMWQTASEENNEGFEIQRSSDGKEWEVIDFVFGHGTTVEAQSYEYIDETPLYGNNYYRLKQIDTDGQFEYSQVIAVVFQPNASKLKLYPNPVITGLLNINYGSEETALVQILDGMGRVIQENTITGTSDILVDKLTSGIYYVQVTSNGGQWVEKLVIKW